MEPQNQKLEDANSEIMSVCRLCLEISTLRLYPVKFVQLILFSVVPDLTLNLSKNPGVCSECVHTLTQAYNFKNRCMNNQERILNYYNTIKESINLYDLIKDTNFNKGNVEKSSVNVENDPKQSVSVNCKAEPSVINKTSQQSDIKSEIVTEVPRVDTEKVPISKTEQKVAVYTDNVIEIQDSDTGSLSDDDSDMEFVEYSGCNKTIELPRVDKTEVPISKTDQRVDVCTNNIIEIQDSNTGDFNGDNLGMEFVEDSECNGTVEKDLFKSSLGNVKKESAINSSGLLDICDVTINYLEEIDYESVITKEESKLDNSCSSKSFLQCQQEYVQSDSTFNLSEPGSSKPPQYLLWRKLSSHLYQCLLCKKTFAQQSNLYSHLLNKHKDVPNVEDSIRTSIFQCQQEYVQSDSTFNPSEPGSSKTPQNLLWRKLSSHLYQCLLCKKTFPQQSNLYSHLLNKHKDVPNVEASIRTKIHYCTYCIYRTINTHNLRIHMFSKHMETSKSHTFKNFQCNHCAYSTFNKGNLMNHLRIHSTQKLFKCVYCEKKFNQKGGLNKHYRHHHREQVQGICNGQVLL